MAERTNPHANLIIGAQDEASPVFDKIKASSQSMAAGVEQAATKAAGAVGGMGDKAAPAAQKLDSVTSSMIRQVQRLNAELEAGSARNAAYFEKMANIKGADTAALAPYLAQLKQAEAAQRVATTGLDQMGMSAKQTTAALRQVPVQFTDIVVSLQGGQSAMQVFLQQGGQLKDMFGGAGNAARALGGYVLGLVNPFTVAAAAVAGFGLAMASVNSKDAALLALSTQLAATGRASAGAVGEIKALVKELNLIPGVSKASATAIITEFAKVNGIGSDLFKSLGSSVADFAAATGTDLPTAAKKLADAFADPAKGAQALEGALGTLTAAQILTIEKMAAMGDKSGAQVAMMDALKQATEGLAKQGMTPLGEATDKMSNAWDALTSSIGNSEAFRTANSWLATLIEKVAELTVGLSQMKPPTWLQYLPVAGPAIGALRMASGTGAGSRSVSGVVGTWDEGGATGSWGPTASETEQQVKAAIAATRGYETQSAAMEKLRGVASQAKDALKELESQNRGGSVEAMRLRDSIAAINEKLADMGKKGAPKGPTKETISEYDKLIKKLSDELPKAAAEAEAAQMGYNKSQTEFLALAGSDVWAKFSNSERARVASLYEGKIASEQAGDAAKELSKAYAEAAAERIKTIQSMERAADSLQSQNDALREEIELIGLSTEQQTLVLQQRNDVIILTKEATLAELERQSAITGTQTRVEIALASEIEALKERNALLGAKGVKEAAKQAEAEWARSVEKYEDIFRQGFADMLNSGKDGWKSFTKSLVTTFKTTVADQIYKMFAQPFVVKLIGSFLGFTGVSGVANAATGGGDFAGAASNGGSAYRAASGFNTGWLTDFGSTMPGSIASTGANLYSQGFETVGSSMMDFGNSIAGYADAINVAGDVLGYGAAIFAAANGKWGQAIGSAIGTYFGGPIGSFIGSTVGKWVDKIFSGDSGTYHTGGAAQYSAATGLRTSLGFRDNEEGLPSYNPNDNIDNQFGTGFGYVERGDQTISAVSGIAQGLSTMLDGVAVAFGEKAGYAVATAFADDTSKDGAWGALRISKDGQELLNWNDTRESKWAPREFADGEEGYKEYLAEIAKDTRSVLLDMDLPSWADTMLESIGDTPSMDQLAATVQQIGVIQATFVDLGKAMEGFASLTDKAFEALMKAAGGIESLAANAGVYYENFYSASEKTAVVKSGVSADLAAVGIDMPKTRKEYRELVDAQLALGESGAKAVAVLLELSGAFASFTPTIEQLAESAGISASQISTTIRDGLLGRISGEEVGASIGKMVTDGIYNAIAGSFADQITQIFMTGIVNPVIQAAITGSSISALVSQASIVVMVEQANAAMKALSAIFEDPEFLAALARINDAVGNLSKSPLKPGQSGGASGYTAPAWEEAIDLDGLIGAVRGSWNDLISEIVNETKTAADELKKLTDFGKSSYELDMEAIQSRAQARTKEYWTPEREQAVYDVVNVKRQQQYQYDNSAGYYASMGPEWAAMAEWARKSADELGAEITALLATIGSAPPEITALIAAEQELLRVRNTLKAADMTGDLRTEIDRLGMSDLERTLAGISDRADDYVKSLQDLGQATDANIGVVGEWEDAMRLDAIKKAWAGVTDSILGEIDRIRGNLSGDSGLAALQAEFAINTAAARAGDTEAGGTLAELSSDILRLSEGTAGSAFDWARMQAQMLASLQETARITSLMGGGMSPVSAASFVAPSQTYEISTPYIPPVSQQGAGNAELIAEIRLLNRRLETLEANTQATALHTQKTSKALERAMPNGDAIATREMA